ncbi:hypothetical protein B296_00017160 [Ensete ventricosum]|uniref:Uncharacterized protein n=1 Tax=Ensete ventricosum TaxID=4639 RepID=A0A427AXE1_ENSVE|nr:hypothetical protein B296_00017160 [Ensete ventricosum]
MKKRYKQGVQRAIYRYWWRTGNKGRIDGATGEAVKEVGEEAQVLGQLYRLYPIFRGAFAGCTAGVGGCTART